MALQYIDITNQNRKLKIGKERNLFRKRRRWWLSGSLSFLLTGFIFLGVYQLLNPISLPIRSIKLGGAFDMQFMDKLEHKVKTHDLNNFLLVDTEAIENDILALSWVESAVVERDWPDTLTITVIQHEAVAKWAKGGLLNRKGMVFFADGSTQKPLPTFYGQEKDRQMMLDAYYQFKKQLAKINMQILQLRINKRGVWTIRLNNGINLIVGRELLEERLQRFVNSYLNMRRDYQKAISRVDLRYSNGFAVAWK